MGAPSTTLEPIRIITRCATRDQFVAMFRRFCTATTVFIPSRDTRPAGLAVAFSIRLADNTTMLRGEGVVLDAWTTNDNPYRRAGIKIGIHVMSVDTEQLHQELLAPTSYAVRLSPAAQLALLGQPASVGVATVETVTPTVEIPPLERPDAPRRDGGADVLPANPLTELGEDGIAAFVDCSLEAFEDGGGVEPIVDGDATERNACRPPAGTLLGVAPLAPVRASAPQLVPVEHVDRVPHPISVSAEPTERIAVPLWQRRVPMWWVATVAAAAALVVLGAVR